MNIFNFNYMVQKVIVTNLNTCEKTAKKIAKEIGAEYMKTEVSTFPDGDLYLKFKGDVKGKKLIIVESFQPNSTKAMMDIVFASNAAKQQGCKKVVVCAPYLAFMRQDKMFNAGECVSAPIMAKLFNENVDKLLTVDPHLHRILKMKDVFSIPAKNLTANQVIGDFVAKKYKTSKKNLMIMGPDWESYQWADVIAEIVGVHSTVLHKDRHSSRNVDVKFTEEVDLKGKTIIIVDDIISTGNTMIKACIKSRKLGAKKIIAIGVHGLFVENAYKKMDKHFDDIFTVNTVIHPSNKIDVADVFIEELKLRI
jgi:ribose-phosphate pyrophosphokinase